MNSLNNNIITTFPVVQNKQEFLVGIFQIRQIFKFTKYTNRLIVGFNEKGYPIYNKQIQRKIEKSRVKKIADYLINDPEATFPTNIVLHLPNEIIDEQKLNNSLIEIAINNRVFEELKKDDGNVYISIIDGQHRIKGIEEAISRLESDCNSLSKILRDSANDDLKDRLNYLVGRLDDLKNIQLVVTFFIDKTLEYQAMVFSTINRTQKRVSQSLVYSLFGLDTGDTPQKTALEVVLRLNSHKLSPFYKRIKLYGGTYDRETSPPLSQATMVRSIVNLISENLRESENDRYKKRKNLIDRTPGSKKYLPFRKFYAIDKDEQISNTLFYYFNCVRELFKDKNHISYWDFPENETSIKNIFHTTVGYDSLLKILVDILYVENPTKIDNLDIFKKYLQLATNLKIDDVSRYSFNNRGKKFLYLDMSILIFPPKSAADKRLKELNDLESNP